MKVLQSSILSALVAGSFHLSSAIDGKHVNGYFVSEHWRNGWVGTCCDCNLKFFAGDINLATIRNGAIVKTDTTYDARNGMAICPAFDLSGTMVVFYRHGTGIAVTSTGTSCMTVNSGKNYVSVMNRDGSNLKNLVTLRDAPYDEIMLAWPAGDWIYYINPKTGGLYQRRSTQVRKVNYKTLEDQFVWESSDPAGWFRRFTLSADGTRMGTQLNGTPGGNCTYAFPAMTQVRCAGGCNGAVSPSGNYFGNYFGGQHLECFLTRVNNGNTLVFTVEPEPTSQWAAQGILLGDIETWAGQNIFDGNEGCELIRFAANSDKWVLQMIGWYGHADQIGQGANSFAANWIDKVAFMASNNPKIPSLQADPNLIHCGNSTGSLWINGGPENCGKWEDTAGVWRAVPGYVPPVTAVDPSFAAMYAPKTVTISRAGGQITFAGNGAYRFRITDLRGRCVLSSTGAGPAMVETKALPAGTYLADIVRAGIRAHSKIVVSQ